MKRKTDNFNKFFNKKRNSVVKEQFKQEKKAAKKERNEAIERRFETKREARWQNQPQTEQNSRSGASKKGAPPRQAGIPKRGEGNHNEGNTHEGKPARTSPGSFRPTHAPAFGSPDKNASSGTQDPNLIPLNKYIAHGGICSRRDAAELIKEGKVLVNGHPVTEPGTKVSPDDLVKVNGKKVTISRNFVYILLNKPKDYITTTDDPQGRKTVLDLTRQATQERVFPVGRLDRNTSGVLLLTNDGDLAQKLAHPKHEIKKIYHVSLDKALTKADFDKIIGGGVNLEDGVANVDVLAYADPKDKTQIGLEIHSGRNRIVRRIFEHLGYDVRGLDRVMYAGLTKKNVQRGKWRLLTEKEIRILKYMNSSVRSSAQNKAMQANQAAFQTKKASWDREVDEFLENDTQSEDSFVDKSAAPEKSSFRKKSAAPGKAPFHKKSFGSEDKRTDSENRTGSNDKRPKSFSRDKKGPAGKKSSAHPPSRNGAPAASKSRGSAPGQRTGKQRPGQAPVQRSGQRPGAPKGSGPSKGPGVPKGASPSKGKGRPSSRPSNRPAK